MKKLIFLCLGCLTATHAYCQNTLEKGMLQYNIGFASTSISYEMRIAKKFTLQAEGGLTVAALSYSSFEGYGYSIPPYISIEARWYYNRDKRELKQKSVARNSGNFVSLAIGDLATPKMYEKEYTGNYLFYTAGWNMQRAWGKHFNFELLVGARLFQGIDWPDTYITPAIRARVGFVIFRARD